MENALMGLPDFALGEAPNPAKQTTFKPLFDSTRKLEMMSNIVIDAPGVAQPLGGANAQGDAVNVNILPDTTQKDQTAKITLAEHQDIIDELKKRSEEELNALRENHKNQVLKQVETLKSSLFEDMANQLESKVAETLAPLVESCVSRNTLDAILKEIRSVAAKDALKSLHLSGPSTLTSLVKQQLAGSQLTIEVEEGDGVELVVTLNDKLISTRLNEWGHRIKGAIL